LFSFACKKDMSLATDDGSSVSPTVITDKQLYDMAFQSGLVYYKNITDTLPFTPNGGGHGGFIHIKFNAIAASALDSTGKLLVGKKFPVGSLIVKNIYKTKGGVLNTVAVMYKSNTDIHKANGWVWGEYYGNENNGTSVNSKGAVCTGCHSITSVNSPVMGDSGNRDYVRIFGLR
jgi:hypothetical protein